ncbi:50S ribosomal protein L3 [Enterobacteriaceae endosymbiont of Macroplea appendiculata]|uniref:50S ribosomal protein L3 n=1 Tax=Enterobacteriaceae endosymbiont of Macroplea appendiculata TaxID=2675790 RepID=UPI001449B650|nr:50S ribosomal protein L3 [Enterobacteriaceae endosymbiont of Macroplea appendiculata]QJC30886.1 50S ribosomal protein L3 [Enterobacteriaceae endosymbiont of Macroplea appendiculata]
MISLIGKKKGMTRIFTEDGLSIPITVIQFENIYVIQIKTITNDGYNAIQMTTGIKKNNRVNKAETGHFAQAKTNVGSILWETSLNNIQSYHIGQKISISVFQEIYKVDVTSLSKGKGFSGTVKRWNFSMQDASHGNSLSHRVPGSIGQNQTPGKVFKGKKMSGQLGNKKVTVQNLKVIKLDIKKNIILIKGSTPGFTGTNVLVKPAIKHYPI